MRRFDPLRHPVAKAEAPFCNLYLNIDFGRTHLVATDELLRSSLPVFHGGNSTAPYNLLVCRLPVANFHLYAVRGVATRERAPRPAFPLTAGVEPFWDGICTDVLPGRFFSALGCWTNRSAHPLEQVKWAVFQVPRTSQTPCP